MIHATGELLLVYSEITIIAASVGPTVIQDDIVVTNISQPCIDEYSRGIEQERFRDITAQSVPVVL